MQSFGYELLYIILPGDALSHDTALIVTNVSEILKKEGAIVLHHELWSERRLAYAIQRSDIGKYILCYFKAPANAAARIQKSLRLLSSIARHCIIRHKNIEEAMGIFFAYNEALKEKRRAAVSRPKERRYDQSRLPEPIARKTLLPLPATLSDSAKPVVPEPSAEQMPEASPVPQQTKEEQKPETGEKEELGTAETPKKKRSLAELDQKLDKLLGEEIEL